MLLVSKENCVGKAMLALNPNGSKSYRGSNSCVMEGYEFPCCAWFTLSIADVPGTC